MCVRVGDVIEPVALRCNVAYRKFFRQYKVLRRIHYHTTMDPRYIHVDRSEEYNCQLMFRAGEKGMSERSELIPCSI